MEEKGPNLQKYTNLLLFSHISLTFSLVIAGEGIAGSVFVGSWAGFERYCPLCSDGLLTNEANTTSLEGVVSSSRSAGE